MAGWWVTLVVGLAVLLLGRRLFWLFVGAAGFAVGFTVAPAALPNSPEWLIVLAALVLGILGAVLAILLQWLAVGLGGFAPGSTAASPRRRPRISTAVALGCGLRGGHRRSRPSPSGSGIRS